MNMEMARERTQRVSVRREQYYWVRYWYWVILGCFKNIAIGIGIVKSLSKYWYWYWVLLRAFQTIGIGIGYC